MIFPYKSVWKLRLFSYLQSNLAFFATKKAPFIRNNFLYNKEFRKARDVGTGEGKLQSPGFFPVESNEKTSKSSVPQREKTRSSSPLQYKGEILYGVHPVHLALLQKRRKLLQLFLRVNQDESPNANNALQKEEIKKLANLLEIPISYIDSRGMKYLAPGAVHQGICLDVGPLPLIEWQENSCENQDSKVIPLWLILNEILDPMNVGAIVRSAYYFGVNKLFMVRGNSCKLSPTVSKASSGVLEIMNIYQIQTLGDFIQARKKDGWNIISTTAYCEVSSCLAPVVDVAELKVSKPTILILGNEGTGIPQDIQKMCDSYVSIYPAQNLHQGIDSLNVSVAAGVILYSLSTQLKTSS